VGEYRNMQHTSVTRKKTMVRDYIGRRIWFIMISPHPIQELFSNIMCLEMVKRTCSSTSRLPRMPRLP
jgi:hypothetical protein